MEKNVKENKAEEGQTGAEENRKTLLAAPKRRGRALYSGTPSSLFSFIFLFILQRFRKPSKIKNSFWSRADLRRLGLAE